MECGHHQLQLEDALGGIHVGALDLELLAAPEDEVFEHDRYVGVAAVQHESEFGDFEVLHRGHPQLFDPVAQLGPDAVHDVSRAFRHVFVGLLAWFYVRSC